MVDLKQKKPKCKWVGFEEKGVWKKSHNHKDMHDDKHKTAMHESVIDIEACTVTTVQCGTKGWVCPLYRQSPHKP